MMSTPQVDLTTRAPQLFYLDSGVAVFRSTVAPEGVIEARKDSICVYNGAPYIKTTDTGNTGWALAQVATAGQYFEKTVVVDLSNTATSGTGLDDLTSITIPADAVAIGQRLNVVADGNFNGAAGNKRLVLLGDNFTILDTGLIAVNQSNWHLEAQALRVSSVGFLLTARLSTNGFGVTSTPVFLGATGYQTPTFSAPYVFKCLGEVANGADSVSQGLFIASLI